MTMLRSSTWLPPRYPRFAVFSSAPLERAVAADAPAVARHCKLTLKNQSAGPYKACIAPATASNSETGKADDNSAASWSAGSCPTAGAVGSCKRSKDTLYYYEGDASGLELGCGFQSGEWKTGS